MRWVLRLAGVGAVCLSVVACGGGSSGSHGAKDGGVTADGQVSHDGGAGGDSAAPTDGGTDSTLAQDSTGADATVDALPDVPVGDGTLPDTEPPPTDSAVDAPASVTISAVVTGLAPGDSVVLENNGVGPVTVMADGMVTVATGVAPGSMYDVTISEQPNSPPETCTLAAPMGTATTDVTLMVVCARNDAGTDAGIGPNDAATFDSAVPVDTGTPVDAGMGMDSAFPADTGGVVDTGGPVDSGGGMDATLGDGGGGTGPDGVLVVTSGQTFDLGTNTAGTGGRTAADGVAYPVTSNPGSGVSTVTATTALVGIAGGDTVMIVTLQDTPSTAGTYELVAVRSVAGSTATLASPLMNSYHGVVEILRVPNYASVTVQSGGTLTAPAFGGGTGGVLAFRAAGSVTVAGTILASELGFPGGTATAGPGWAGGSLPTASSGYAGGSFVCGSAFAPGGGGVTQAGFNNTCVNNVEASGAGGNGMTNMTGFAGGSAGGAGGSGDIGSGALGGSGLGSGGGGGGGSCGGTANEGNGGGGGNGGTATTPALGGLGGGGGGGGGAPGCGAGTGAAGGSGGNGQSSALNAAVMSTGLLQLGAGSGFGGGGGGGGATADTPGYAGSGGAPGGSSYTGPAAGGPSGTRESSSAPGGGAIYIVAGSLNVTGLIAANGGAGGSGSGGGGGVPGACGGGGAGGGGGGGAGGAGGVITLVVPGASLGMNLVEANGGQAGLGAGGGQGGLAGCSSMISTQNNGGGGGQGGAGAAGGSGVIVVQGAGTTGSTSPPFVP